MTVKPPLALLGEFPLIFPPGDTRELGVLGCRSDGVPHHHPVVLDHPIVERELALPGAKAVFEHEYWDGRPVGLEVTLVVPAPHGVWLDRIAVVLTLPECRMRGRAPDRGPQIRKHLTPDGDEQHTKTWRVAIHGDVIRVSPYCGWIAASA